MIKTQNLLTKLGKCGMVVLLLHKTLMFLQNIHARAAIQAAIAKNDVKKARKALNDCVTAVRTEDHNRFYIARKDFWDAINSLAIIARTSCQACYVSESFWENLSPNDLAVFAQARLLFRHTD